MTLPILNRYNIILASASPRREQLLRGAGFEFEVRLKPVEEVLPDNVEPFKIPEFLSRIKADPFMGSLKSNDLLITADTLVYVNEKIIGKPTTVEEAAEMLKEMSGRCHKVITGVSLTSLNKQLSFSSLSLVWFRELQDDEIFYYIDNYRPYDKAGAYGIQEWIGYVGIERIEGSFYNVMGLPVQRVYEEIKRF